MVCNLYSWIHEMKYALDSKDKHVKLLFQGSSAFQFYNTKVVGRHRKKFVRFFPIFDLQFTIRITIFQSNPGANKSGLVTPPLASVILCKLKIKSPLSSLPPNNPF